MSGLFLFLLKFLRRVESWYPVPQNLIAISLYYEALPYPIPFSNKRIFKLVSGGIVGAYLQAVIDAKGMNPKY